MYLDTLALDTLDHCIVTTPINLFNVRNQVTLKSNIVICNDFSLSQCKNIFAM